MSNSKAKLPSTLIHTLSTHTAPINAITFSSLGGTYILTGSSDRQIHLSRSEPSTLSSSSTPPTTTAPIQKYSAHGYAVLDITVSSDNQTFASVGGDRAVFLWDVQTPNTTIRRFGTNTASNHSHSSRINCVTFAGSGDSVLVSGSDDTSVRIWDVKSRDAKPVMVLDEAKDGISSLAIPKTTGYEIVSGSIDGRVRSYDIRMGRVVVDVMPGPVTSLDLSKDAKTILVGCLDGRVRVMDRADGTCLRALPGLDEEQADDLKVEGGIGRPYKNESLRLKSCFALNERLVLSGSEDDGGVRGWDVLTGKTVGRVEVNSPGKVVSVVKWREGSQVQGRQGVWAGGGVQGLVKIYAAG